jgi:uncharacterized protein with PQ loop repeat
MNIQFWCDVTGYLAMTLLVISFLPKKLTAVRMINLVACLFFVVYGILLGWAWPIIISNTAVSLVQAYHLLVNRPKKHGKI